MNSKHVISRVILRAAAVLALIVLSGCSLPLQATTVPPTQDLKPTFDAVAAEAVQTVVAQITQSVPTAAPATATIAPTNTPAFTDTPVPTFTPAPPTATPTRTFVPWTNTPRATATYGYNCRITEQGPGYGDDFPARSPFDGRWKVKNTSDETWRASDVDFKYLSGTKFQDDVDTLDLGGDVDEDEEYTVIIDMTAPETAGRYSATWGFVQGGKILCAVNVTIDVK
jgi:hypothetical protein